MDVFDSSCFLPFFFLSFLMVYICIWLLHGLPKMTWFVASWLCFATRCCLVFQPHLLCSLAFTTFFFSCERTCRSGPLPYFLTLICSSRSVKSHSCYWFSCFITDNVFKNTYTHTPSFRAPTTYIAYPRLSVALTIEWISWYSCSLSFGDLFNGLQDFQLLSFNEN